ncbi:MAG: HAMP domain-containing histidine kinase [Chromatiales bacterium]|nr:HAMP domain-containing histidine kinase [Chromatiales bacterium]
MLALPLTERPQPLAARRRRPADSLVVAALPAGVALRHADGRITPCNVAARALVSAAGDRLDAVLGSDAPGPAMLLLESGARLRIEQRALPGSTDQLLLFTDVTREHRLDEALSRHQRLASLGELAATLAHQVRTPLAAALLYLDNARLPALDADRRAALLDQASTCLRDLEQLVAGLLGFARGAAHEDRSTPLADVLDGVATAAAPLCRPNQRLEIDPPAAGLAVAVGRESLVAALLNLVQNALQAAGPGAIVRITATATGGGVELAVTDNGPGIPPALRGRVLEPFFTTRSGGTGLGLAVVQSLVTGAGGSVGIDANAPRGTRITLRLPCVATPGARA